MLVIMLWLVLFLSGCGAVTECGLFYQTGNRLAINGEPFTVYMDDREYGIVFGSVSSNGELACGMVIDDNLERYLEMDNCGSIRLALPPDSMTFVVAAVSTGEIVYTKAGWDHFVEGTFSGTASHALLSGRKPSVVDLDTGHEALLSEDVLLTHMWLGDTLYYIGASDAKSVFFRYGCSDDAPEPIYALPGELEPDDGSARIEVVDRATLVATASVGDSTLLAIVQDGSVVWSQVWLQARLECVIDGSLLVNGSPPDKNGRRDYGLYSLDIDSRQWNQVLSILTVYDRFPEAKDDSRIIESVVECGGWLYVLMSPNPPGHNLIRFDPKNGAFEIVEKAWNVSGPFGIYTR